MTAFEELTREFDDASIASEIIESLLDNGYEIREGSVEALGRGYTGARLAKALLDEGSTPVGALSSTVLQARRTIGASRDSTCRLGKMHLRAFARSI